MYSSFEDLKKDLIAQFQTRGKWVKNNWWQGKDVSKKPDMETFELLNHSSTLWLPDEKLSGYREDIKPDLPWADNHFLERVGGYPLNPGTEWENWRLSTGADKSRSADGRFNHNYMERYWPKYARMVPPSKELDILPNWLSPHKGILYEYGDLRDVVHLLNRDPLTRQAYLPVWFPEDTGTVHQDRSPCTLGYHFILRHDQLHGVYYLRSCDVINHWKNDLYLTIRLMIWILEELRKLSPEWQDITVGTLTTHITSFHCFRANMEQLEKL